MNVDQIKGHWQIIKGMVKEEWGRLTDDELNVNEGQIDQLAGRVALKYGIAKEEAHRKLEEFCNSCTAPKPPKK